jgi:hypothetical protein
MTIDLIILKLNKFIRNNYKIFFSWVEVAYLKGPKAAHVLNPTLTEGYTQNNYRIDL